MVEFTSLREKKLQKLIYLIKYKILFTYKVKSLIKKKKKKTF